MSATPKALSSQVQRLKAQLEEKNRPSELPSHNVLHGHHTKARTQKERERIQIETAKKMASRFNLTYRALALSAAKKTAENRAKDMQAAREARENAAKYQMTARALQMSSTGTSTGRVNVLNHEDAAAAAAAANAESASHNDDDGGYSAEPNSAKFMDLSSLEQPIQAEEEEEKPVAVAVAPPPPERVMSSSNYDEEAEDEVPDMPKQITVTPGAPIVFDDTSSVINVPVGRDEDLLSIISERDEDEDAHDAFWLPDLSKALVEGDENAINIAVVQSFFAEFDPSRVGEAAELLRAHAGREEQLMDSLNMQYPQQQQDAAAYNEMEALEEVERVRSKSIQLSAPPPAPRPVSTIKDSGYILTAVKKEDGNGWAINTTESEHATLLRKRMQAKGYGKETIEAFIGSESEML